MINGLQEANNEKCVTFGSIVSYLILTTLVFMSCPKKYLRLILNSNPSSHYFWENCCRWDLSQFFTCIIIVRIFSYKYEQYEKLIYRDHRQNDITDDAMRFYEVEKTLQTE